MRPLRDGLLITAGAVGTTLVWSVLRREAQRKPSRASDERRPWATRWERTNHAGRPVTLLEGLALVAGTTGTAVLTRSAWTGSTVPYAVASLGAGSLGALDDLRQDTDRKGLAGHLSALAHGRVTTGAVKVIGLAATGLAAAALEDRLVPQVSGPHASGLNVSGLNVSGLNVFRAHASGLSVPGPLTSGPHGAGRRHHLRPSLGEAGSMVVGGAVVAGAANLANLFDLRPGRALKVGVLVAVPLVLSGRGSPAGAVTLGACLALLPADLAGTSMLGDTGANPLGAVLGLAVVQRQGGPGRLVSLAVITALTLASERVSFTRVIEATPVLRALDRLGRPG